MQLLYEHSEEGDTPCLARVPGRVRRLVGSASLPVPHMGWSRLSLTTNDPLFTGTDEGAYVYFVHGFAAEPGPTTIATATHGVPFAAALRHGHLWGTQFHPERSGAVGARVLEGFLEATSTCA